MSKYKFHFTSISSTVIFTATFFLTLISANVAAQVNDIESASEDMSKPNIIFFIADDQDIYDYGCYGNNKVHTPAVDRLAHEGILFENAFTSQSICAPSRSQLLTGMYPLKNGCFANHTAVKPNIESVTKRMRALGYEVVRAGKSHLNPSSVFDWDKKWDAVHKEDVPRKYIPLDSIEAYMKQAKKPFFMYIASYYPHATYFNVEDSNEEDIKFFPFNENKKSDLEFVKRKAGYYRSIQEDNTQLEHVLAYVDKYLDKNNTLFIYSADHGVSGKFTVKDVGLRVPLVARWPNVIKPRAKSSQLVHYVDVLPTFMDIAGGKPAAELDGKSILPLFRGEDKEIHTYVYGVRTNQNILNSEVFPSRMIRDKRYKYIRNFNSIEVMEQNLGDKPQVNYFIRRGAMAFKNEPFEELYDIQNDPFEQHNLIKDAKYQGIIDRLKTDLFKWMASQDDFLNEEVGDMPLITAKGKKGFKLDRDTPKRNIPDSIKNTLNEEDYLIIKHW